MPDACSQCGCPKHIGICGRQVKVTLEQGHGPDTEETWTCQCLIFITRPKETRDGQG